MEFKRRAIYMILMLTILMTAGCATPLATAVSIPATISLTPAIPIKSEIKVTVSDDEDARATQAVMKKWIAAYQNHDAQLLLSLWSDKITWTVCSADCVDYSMDTLKYAVPSDFANPKMKTEFESYTILNAGKFAVIHSNYQDPSTDAKNSTPATCILEFKSGKIIKETWYYITS